MDSTHGHAATAVATSSHDGTGTAHAAAPSLVDFVRTEARRMEFDHAMLLLEKAMGSKAVRDGRLRVRSRPGPEFPIADIESVTEEDGVVTTEVTFMGLYGPSAALPRYFTEPIAHEEADALRAFLDLFGGRLYGLYHRAWRKYRPRVRFDTDEKGEAQAASADSLPFLALAGVPPTSGPGPLPIPPMRLAALAGRLSTRVRNAVGLRDLLGHFLKVPVAIEENHPRWVTAPARGQLGGSGRSGIRLGQGALLGGRIYDVSGKVRLVMGPLDLDDFRSLLPDGDRAELARALTRFYLPDGLDFDVELKLRSAQTHRLLLGDGMSKLGRNAWVGQTAPGLVSEIISYN